MPPKIYLIKSDLPDEELERVRAALAIAPPVGTFVFSPEDAEKAKRLSDAPPVSTEQPLAILAKFQAHPLAVIDADGNVEILIEGHEQ